MNLVDQDKKVIMLSLIPVGITALITWMLDLDALQVFGVGIAVILGWCLIIIVAGVLTGIYLGVRDSREQ